MKCFLLCAIAYICYVCYFKASPFIRMSQDVFKSNVFLFLLSLVLLFSLVYLEMRLNPTHPSIQPCNKTFIANLA